MIKVTIHEGRAQGAIDCDLCHKPVTDGTRAIVGFSGEWAPGAALPFRIAHKACDNDGARRRAGDQWMPLDAFLVMLAEHSGIRWGSPEAMKSLEMISSTS
ncbi:MAG: hypothetical protein U1E39_13260 [Planctomycetota bacterium]